MQSEARLPRYKGARAIDVAVKCSGQPQTLRHPGARFDPAPRLQTLTNPLDFVWGAVCADSEF